MPYTQRDKSQAAARLTKEPKRYENEMNNVRRLGTRSVRGKLGEAIIATEIGCHKTQNA